MQGATDLAESERGVFCIAAVLIATVLVILHQLTGAQWIDFVKWIAVTLVVSKTVTGVVETRQAPTSTTSQPA